MKEFPNPKKIPYTGRLRVCTEKIITQKLKNKILIDVGCSNGWLEKKLESCKLKDIVGVDPSNDAIKSAKKYAPNARYFVSNADKIPVKNNYANFLTMFDVIEHVPFSEENLALNEANRVLKKRGRLFLSTPNNNFLTNILDPAWYIGHRHYTTKKIKKLIQNAGFKIEKIEIRGGIWFSLYLLWIYFFKRVTNNPLPRNNFLEKIDDEQFNKIGGIHTIYVSAIKK